MAIMGACSQGVWPPEVQVLQVSCCHVKAATAQVWHPDLCALSEALQKLFNIDFQDACCFKMWKVLQMGQSKGTLMRTLGFFRFVRK